MSETTGATCKWSDDINKCTFRAEFDGYCMSHAQQAEAAQVRQRGDVHFHGSAMTITGSSTEIRYADNLVFYSGGFEYHITGNGNDAIGAFAVLQEDDRARAMLRALLRLAWHRMDAEDLRVGRTPEAFDR